jgi:hypothetical protein
MIGASSRRLLQEKNAPDNSGAFAVSPARINCRKRAQKAQNLSAFNVRKTIAGAGTRA